MSWLGHLRRLGCSIFNKTLVRFIISRALITFNAQMLATAVGYELYELTHSALWLGLAGFVQFIPRLLFIFLAGTLADTRGRQKIIACTQFVILITCLLLAVTTKLACITPVVCLFFVFCYGSAYSIQAPSTVSILPTLVEPSRFAKATAFVTSVLQFVTIAGPAVGGLLYVFGPEIVYLLISISSGATIFLVLSLEVRKITAEAISNRPESPLAGFRYIRSNPGILGALTLDMFAVLFGGATALLPVFAKDVLNADSVAFGFLRAAPAVGALLTSAILAKFPLKRHTGKKMFLAVVVFAVAIIFFALSRNILVSIVLLTISGAADIVSVVIRSTFVQLKTPDEVRGRVSAVNMIFIGASNQLGEFESGIVASGFGALPGVAVGAVPATFFSGICTLVVTGVWYCKFRDLRELDRI
ncbi:MAG: MFS transporter [Candidatus Ancillula trichonymphae]|nr:MFS transporter [Candidatus Ancillula trichonymphae]